MPILSLITSTLTCAVGLLVFAASANFEPPEKRPIACALFLITGLILTVAGIASIARVLTLAAIYDDPYWATSAVVPLAFRVALLLGSLYAVFVAAQVARNLGRFVLSKPRRKMNWFPPANTRKGALSER